ncbi:MAG: TrmH family RNA methyltransferase [Gammaproteobacteria bacterium]|nr:TrmH family RNA methyltransferase [Gammaproteobacteria bacterium]
MEIKKYKSDSNYSYSLGAFPTIELLRNKSSEVIKVFIHSTFKNEEVINEIYSLLDNSKIEYNDKIISKLSDKENVYIVGVFNKYESKLDPNKNHLVLDNPSNMGNLGTIIRSSLGFEINNVAIIRPGVDYFNPKAIRASMGSIFSTNIEMFDSLEDYSIKYPNHKQYKFMLQASKSLRDEAFDSDLSSLVFGNEATGINIKYLDNNALIIKHSNKIDSLNITNAVSIALYEFHEKKNK